MFTLLLEPLYTDAGAVTCSDESLTSAGSLTLIQTWRVAGMVALMSDILFKKVKRANSATF